MRTRITVALLAGLLPPVAAFAQEATSGPPPVLLITQEQIKPGSIGPHNKHVESYLALFKKANTGNQRLGLAPVAGDTNQVVYLQGYGSFAEMEAAQKKQEAAFAASPAYQAELDALDRQAGPMHESQKAMVAVYRADLSYRPLGMEGVAKSRYFQIATFQINAGRTADYEEFTKQFNRAREKANLDEHAAVYQVTSGAPFGTFVSFIAFRSLAEQDTFRQGLSARNKAIDDAIGGDIVVKQRREMAAAIFGEGSSALYAFDPKLSQPTAQFAALDPDFWTPKAAAKATATVKKEAKKP